MALVWPFVIKGRIHDTVIYCKRVRLSSGVLNLTVGAVKTGLIPSRDSNGSRIGMFNTMNRHSKDDTAAIAIGASLIFNGSLVCESMITRSRNKPVYITSNDGEYALGCVEAMIPMVII